MNEPTTRIQTKERLPKSKGSSIVHQLATPNRCERASGPLRIETGGGTGSLPSARPPARKKEVIVHAARGGPLKKSLACFSGVSKGEGVVFRAWVFGARQAKLKL